MSGRAAFRWRRCPVTTLLAAYLCGGLFSHSHVQSGAAGGRATVLRRAAGVDGGKAMGRGGLGRGDAAGQGGMRGVSEECAAFPVVLWVEKGKARRPGGLRY